MLIIRRLRVAWFGGLLLTLTSCLLGPRLENYPTEERVETKSEARKRMAQETNRQMMAAKIRTSEQAGRAAEAAKEEAKIRSFEAEGAAKRASQDQDWPASRARSIQRANEAAQAATRAAAKAAQAAAKASQAAAEAEEMAKRFGPKSEAAHLARQSRWEADWAKSNADMAKQYAEGALRARRRIAAMELERIEGEVNQGLREAEQAMTEAENKAQEVERHSQAVRLGQGRSAEEAANQALNEAEKAAGRVEREFESAAKNADQAGKIAPGSRSSKGLSSRVGRVQWLAEKVGRLAGRARQVVSRAAEGFMAALKGSSPEEKVRSNDSSPRDAQVFQKKGNDPLEKPVGARVGRSINPGSGIEHQDGPPELTRPPAIVWRRGLRPEPDDVLNGVEREDDSEENKARSNEMGLSDVVSAKGDIRQMFIRFEDDYYFWYKFSQKETRMLVEGRGRITTGWRKVIHQGVRPGEKVAKFAGPDGQQYVECRSAVKAIIEIRGPEVIITLKGKGTCGRYRKKNRTDFSQRRINPFFKQPQFLR